MMTRCLLLSIVLAFACTRGTDPDTSRGTAETASDPDAVTSTDTATPSGTAGTRPSSVSYGCSDEYRFVAQMMDGGDSVRLLLPDTTLTLPHVVSASGARFSEGGYAYWSKGNEALLETPRRSFAGCVSDGGGAPWQEAKSRGARFRAVGQEPFWNLVMEADGEVVIEADLGETHYYLPPTEPEVDGGIGRTVYRYETEAHRASIVIEDDPCRDAMSGWPYEATVSMTLDGREYRGCGRWL
ncbi:MAG: MliC family protein [Gemmatimonadota bacterium]